MTGTEDSTLAPIAAPPSPSSPIVDALRTTAAAPQRLISAPVVGSVSTDPIAAASSSSPSAPLLRSSSCRVSGIRETHEAKAKPLSANEIITALRAARTVVPTSARGAVTGPSRRNREAPPPARTGSPSATDGLIARSMSPWALEQITITWSAYNDICSWPSGSRRPTNDSDVRRHTWRGRGESEKMRNHSRFSPE